MEYCICCPGDGGMEAVGEGARHKAQIGPFGAERKREGCF